MAVDTNVFSALFSGDPVSASEARIALQGLRMDGTIVVAPVVYAELVAGRDEGFVDRFLLEKDIEVDWSLGQDIWRTAGTQYGAYARTRRRQGGDTGPRRILADFLIGAHALHLAAGLLTSDERIYGTFFPELRVFSPQQMVSRPEDPRES